MVIDIRADLLRKRLREAEELHAFWRYQRELYPQQAFSLTLGSLQQQLDELQAQLKTLGAGQ